MNILFYVDTITPFLTLSAHTSMTVVKRKRVVLWLCCWLGSLWHAVTAACNVCYMLQGDFWGTASRTCLFHSDFYDCNYVELWKSWLLWRKVIAG